METYRNAELEQFLVKAEELGWNYNLYKENGGRTYAEMMQESPLGEDFGMIIDFNEENPLNTFMSDLKGYYYSFDPEEHAEIWIGNRGKNGTPDSIQDLLDDAKDIEEMIGELIQYLEDDDEEKDMKNTSYHMEMSVGKLKAILKDIPDDMPVFVACEGYCNYDFDRKQPCDDTDTFGIVHDGKLFITDDCAVDIGNGETL